MLLRRTEKIYFRKDEGIMMGVGSQLREYRRRIYWLLFIPIYSTYEIISKVK